MTKIEQQQVNEITEHFIYSELSKLSTNQENSKILNAVV